MNNLKGALNSGGAPLRGLTQLGKVLFGVGAVSYLGYNSLYTVDGGHRAVVFDRIRGVLPHVSGEGTHLMIPWVQWPIIFDIRTKPKQIKSPTGTRDLQTVNLALRVLYKPDPASLPTILSDLGTNYDERVLPSIVNEVLKSVIAQYNAAQLTTQREEVSRLIRRNLTDRAEDFNLLVDDVSITHLSFGRDYAKAVEDKQVAQQDAERARFLVEQAMQDKKSVIIKAQGEAKSARMVGKAIRDNPGFLELRRLEAAREIAHTISNSANRVYLDADTLLMNLTSDLGFNVKAGSDPRESKALA